MTIPEEDRGLLVGTFLIAILVIFMYFQLKCSYCWSPHLAKTRVIETKDGVESKTKWCYHHWDFRYDYSDVDNGEDLRFRSGKYIVIQKHKKDVR